MRILLPQDRCEGQFVFGRTISEQPNKLTSISPNPVSKTTMSKNDVDAKNQLQTVLARAGYERPTYNTGTFPKLIYRSTVVFNGLSFTGQTCNNKKLAEKDAANEALKWLNTKGALNHKQDVQKKRFGKPSKEILERRYWNSKSISFGIAGSGA